jgi:acetyl esterase/lipase
MEDFARQTGAAVVFPYYTPAPEAQYPIQFEQVYGVLEHFVTNGDKYNLKVDRFGLAGDSVGGKYFFSYILTRLIHQQDTWLSQ